MVLFRILLLVSLLVIAGLFVRYVWTGEVRYRTYGLTVLKWTVGAALVFFGLLAVEQLA